MAFSPCPDQSDGAFLTKAREHGPADARCEDPPRWCPRSHGPCLAARGPIGWLEDFLGSPAVGEDMAVG